MSVLITGDTHGTYDIHKLSSKNFNYNNELGLTKDDYLIITGDFGLVWNYKGEDDTEKYWLDWLDKKPWTTLFCDGNHSNHQRLNNDFHVEEWNGGKIHRIRESVIHLMRGQVFDLQDKKFFTMGGASSHDRQWRVEGKSWWPEEVPSQDERNEALMNLDDNDWKVDYVITHDAPAHIAKQLIRALGDRSRVLDEYEEWLETEIASKLDFKQWFFGHYHVDLEFPDGKYEAMYYDIASIDDFQDMNLGD